MHTRRRLIFLGIINAIGAALVCAVVTAIASSERFSEGLTGALVLPIYAVFVFSWYIVPLGAICGLLLPPIVRRRPVPVAAVIGAAIGLGISLVTAFVVQGVSFYLPVARGTAEVQNVKMWWSTFWHLTAMSAAQFAPVCIVWSAFVATYINRHDTV